MRPLKSLTLEAIVDLLATRFGVMDDARAVEQCRYALSDTLMSGFAMMFFQHPSLLQFQRAMEKKRQRCNLQRIFGVHAIPSDTQMREILDGVEPEALRGILPQLPGFSANNVPLHDPPRAPQTRTGADALADARGQSAR
jgi:hypothetical protein